jgi:hypothetical protein
MKIETKDVVDMGDEVWVKVGDPSTLNPQP